MSFWKPGTANPGVIDREAAAESTPLYNSNAHLSLRQQRLKLPISPHRTAILYLVENCQVTIVVGHTGCGKTTQIPQYLHESGWTAGGRCVACTQPRRVAATTVAARTAEEMGVTLGKEVGYAVRFDECWDPESTRIKYMTDGMLVREFMHDPLLSRYSVVMLDEAHERSIHTDLLMALLKKVLKRRRDLRLVLASATLNAEEFRDYFCDSGLGESSHDSKVTAEIISVEGRLFPVDILYAASPVADYVVEMVSLVKEIHISRPVGDILVFLTGQEEIEEGLRMVREIVTGPGERDLWPLPLYSGLQHADQLRVFEPSPPGTRKVVLATNIAESSVTIDGIVYVIDCGFVKQRVHNPLTGTEALPTLPAAKASLAQRAGRAGRIRPGICFRLMTEADYDRLPSTSVPDMQRVNLAPIVLQLKALGIDDVVHFPFLSPPAPESLARALDLLYSLGALDDAAKLTADVGEKLAEFPVEPMMAKMILKSGEAACAEEILTIAAMLSVFQIFVSGPGQRAKVDRARRKFAVHEGDHLTLYNVYSSFQAAWNGETKGFSNRGRLLSDCQARARQWAGNHGVSYRSLMRARDIRAQLRKYAMRFGVKMNTAPRGTVEIRKCIVAGFFSHAAHRQSDGTYVTIRDQQVISLHPNSSVFKYPPEWIVYHECTQTDKLYARDVCAIKPEWLSEIAPHFYEYVGRSSASTEDASKTAV